MEHLGVGQPRLRLSVPVVGSPGQVAGGLGEPDGLDLAFTATHRQYLRVYPAPAGLGGDLVTGSGVAGAGHVGGRLVEAAEFDQDVGEGRGTRGQVRTLAHPGQPTAAAPQLVLGRVEVIGEQGDAGNDEAPVERVSAGAPDVPDDLFSPAQVVPGGVEVPRHGEQQGQLGEQGTAQAAVVPDAGQRPGGPLDRFADRARGETQQVDEVTAHGLGVTQHAGLLGMADGGLHGPLRLGVAAGRHVGGGLTTAGERGTDLVPVPDEDR